MKLLKTTASISLILASLFTSSDSKAILGGTIPFTKACYHNDNLIGVLSGIEVNWNCEDKFAQEIKDDHNKKVTYIFVGYYIENLPVGTHEKKQDHSAEECVIHSTPLM